MPTYAIGDLQGCYTPLRALLKAIQFNPEHDVLWFTGDLVNRGPESLETLRFIKSLGDQHRIVLGNHDLHLLACAAGSHTGWEEDTFHDILHAQDKAELLTWLSQQSLAIYEKDFLMVHAGVAATWNIETTLRLANEVEQAIQSSQSEEYFKNMYGNFPDEWSETLTGWERLRCITNYLTRVRFCHPDGRIELKNKGTLLKKPEHLVPWFQLTNRKTAENKIIFGHWAALGGETNTPNTFALDTGCIWGYALTAMRLEDGRRFQVACGSV